MRRFGKEIGVRDWVSGNRYWVIGIGYWIQVVRIMLFIMRNFTVFQNKTEEQEYGFKG